MRNSFRSTTGFWVVALCLALAATAFAGDTSSSTTTASATAAATAAPATAGPGSPISPTLIDLLVKKGVLTSAEASSLRNASGSAGMEQLLRLLKAKGVVTDTEAAELKSAGPDAYTMHSLIDTESGGMQTGNLTSPQTTQPKPAETGTPVIPAIAPVRVLSLDPPTKDSLAHAWKLGSGAYISPYGL